MKISAQASFKKLAHLTLMLLASIILLGHAPQVLATDAASSIASTVTSASSSDTVTALPSSTPVEPLAASIASTTDASASTESLVTASVADATVTARPSSSAVIDPTAADAVTIIHTNDIHGRLEEASGVIGVAKEATIVEDIKANSNGRVLVLDAGDAFQGLPISNNSEGAAMAAALNAIGYDAMTVGNHEFDFGYDQAMAYKSLLNFPIVTSNVYKNGVRSYDAYTIVEKAGEKFAIIGVTTPETATKTHPNNVVGVTFTEPIDEVKKVVAEVLTNNPDINNYIVLAHLGVDETTKTEWRGDTLAESLANTASLISKQVMVIDGHSHTVLNKLFGNVQYAQTRTALANIGKILYNLGQNNFQADLIKADSTKEVTADRDVATLVAETKVAYESKISEILVPNNPVELNGERSNVRVRETNLGNIVADAIYTYAQSGFSHQADLAVTNGGGLRATIEKDRPITVGETVAVLPFGNIISQIQVTGQQIKDMFKASLAAAIQKDDQDVAILDKNTGLPLLNPAGAYLQTSGVKVYYDPQIASETGERILKIEILDKQTQVYKELALDAIYHLATNDFIAAGGDAYTMLTGAREEGPSLDEVFAQYLKTADLESYAEINPNARVIAIDSAADADGDGFANAAELSADTDPYDKASYPGSKKTTENPVQDDKKSTDNKGQADNQNTADSRNTTKNQVQSDNQASQARISTISSKTKGQTQSSQSARDQATPASVARLSTTKTTTHPTASTQSAQALPKTGQAESPIYLVSGLVFLGLGLHTIKSKKDQAA